MYLCHLASLDDLVKRSVRIGHDQVFIDGAAKQHRFLRDHAKVRTQLVGAQVANVNAVYFYLPAAGQVKPEQQFSQGRFTHATWPRDGNSFAGLNAHTQVGIEHG